MSDAYRPSRTVTVGVKHRQLGVGTHDLTALTGCPQKQCARRVVPMAAGSFTQCVGEDGVDEPITDFPEGFVHDSLTAVITTTVAIVVYY